MMTTTPVPTSPTMGAGDRELPASRLGQKEYWDAVYEEEIVNLDESGDSGEVWFGRSVAQKVVQWIIGRVSQEAEKRSGSGVRVLDIGCGNGFTLLLLHRNDCVFERLTGIDYSPPALTLAAKVAASEGADIDLRLVDVLQPEDCLQGEEYDFVVDKGTFDAISLNADIAIPDARQKYICFVDRHMSSSGSHFIITSCNWTKNELLVHFSGHFVLVDEISSPTLIFGGQSGSRVTTLIFKKGTQQ